MSAPTIADRMQDFFSRQIAWLSEAAEAYRVAGDDFDMDRLLEAASERTQSAQALEREYVALKREWDAAEPSASERAEVGEMANRAETLVREVETRIQEAIAHCSDRSDAIRRELGSLRKGRQEMNHYKTEDNDPGYVDRKA